MDQVGTHYYKGKGKSLLAIRVSEKALASLQAERSKKGVIKNKLVENILLHTELNLDRADMDFKKKTQWTTYIDDELHKQLKIKSVMMEMNLKDVAGLILESYYEEKKTSKKNSPKEG